jgi:hypothetical protein
MMKSPQMALLFASLTAGTTPGIALAANHLTDLQLAAMYAGAGNGNGNGNVGSNNGNGNVGNSNGNGNVGNNSGNGNASDSNGNNDGSNKGNGSSTLAGTSIAAVTPAATTGATPKTAAVSNLSGVQPVATPRASTISLLPLGLAMQSGVAPSLAVLNGVSLNGIFGMGGFPSAAVAIPSVR